MKRLTKEWLKAANYDLILINEIVHNNFLTQMVAFHSQQAIEKTLKAILVEKEGKAPKIHDLLVLKGKIENYVKLPAKNLNIFLQINELYIDSRYPTDLGLLPSGEPSKEIAEEFYKTAKEIHKNITDFLSET